MSNMNIVDRVVLRLKEQPLGDLITEEDLHDIVKEAIPKTFFEERRDTSGYHTKIIEPAIFQIMKEVLKEHVKSSVDKWVVENHQMVMKQWETMMDQGIADYVAAYEAEKVKTLVREMLTGYNNRMNEERRKLGLPDIYI